MELIKPAFSVLSEYFNAPSKNLKLVLAKHLGRGKEKDKAGTTRAVYGVVRKEELINSVIRHTSRRGPGQIEPETLILLKIGIYLLIFSRSYPDHAVVNELVNFAKSRARKFLNANLRAVIREREPILEMLRQIDDPQTRFSISPYLIENLEHLSDDLEVDLRYLNREPQFHLRVNTRTYSYDEIKKNLSGLGVEFLELPDFQSFQVKGFGAKIQELLKNNYLYLQNTGSQLVPIIASHFARDLVFDCCAAPGTKAVTLSLLDPDLKIIANDINPQRVWIMDEFIHDFQLTQVHSMVSDIRKRATRKVFDFIMVDAPCSSSATLRKNPDLKLKINAELVERNARSQLEIMSSLENCTAPGGFILYAVCSFIRDETEDILEKVVRGGDFEPIDFCHILDELGFDYKMGDYGIYLLPSEELNNDLFYISLLRKVE